MIAGPAGFRPQDQEEGPGLAGRPGPALLSAVQVTRRFFGVTVLDGVSIRLNAGEVRALLGENGAGKSTLINLLSGVHRPDAGEIRLDGAPVRFARPLDADLAGISVVRQELALFPDLGIAEAIFAGHLPLTRWGLVDHRLMRARASEALARLGCALDVTRPVASLSIAEQQLVEIARALTRRSRVVIMDEPTAALSRDEVQRLHEVITQLAAEGVAILYVSHRLDEIRSLCHSYSVLRDGRLVAEGAVRDVATEDLIRAMAGRDLAPPGPAEDRPRGAPVLELRHLSGPPRGRQPRRVSDVSLTVHAGEILGLAGLVGAGRTEVARMVFGLDTPGGGEIRLAGQPFAPRSPRQAMAAGVGLVPEDRKGQSICPDRSVLENFALTGGVAPRAVGFNDRHAERARLAEFTERLGIRFARAEAAMATLSGGNQQKVILARWIARSPRLLIVDEPTRGIDVAAKAEVHALLREIVARGVAILLISSDLPEILALSDRIVTLCEGRSTGEFARADASAEAIMARMTRRHP